MIPREQAVREMQDMNATAMEYAKLHSLNFLSFHDSDPGFHQAYANCDDEMACEFIHAAIARLHPKNRARFFKIEFKDMLNKTAREARNAALARHKEELRIKDAEIKALEVKLRQADEISSKHYANLEPVTQNLKIWKALAIIALIVIMPSVVLLSLAAMTNSQVLNEPPPALQKVQVVTHGFVDENGVWRNYENGEPIKPQPIGWMKP